MKGTTKFAIGGLLAALAVAGVVYGSRLYTEKEEKKNLVSPEQTVQARSISRGELLEFEDRALVFSNGPEFAHYPGILCRVDNATSNNGKVRLLYSHLNLLTDPANPEENVPGKIGFVMVNNTGRTIDVMWERKALVRNIDEHGKPLVKANPAPLNPETGTQTDYGALIGLELLKKWFDSGNGKDRQLLVTLQPGQKHFIHEVAGKRGWSMGMFDLVLVDHETKKPIVRNDLKEKEGFGIQVFAAHKDADLEQFYANSQTEKSIMPAEDVINKTNFHHRGFFLPGVYPTAPQGEGITRKKTITYDPQKDGPVHMQVHNPWRYQHEDPNKPFYNPEMFLNDTIKSGIDEYGVKEVDGKRVVEKMNGQVNGEYGADYIFTLKLKGPTHVAIQAAGWNTKPDQKAPVDVYDQYFAYQWDGKTETVNIKDPHFEDYYKDFSKLSPPGLTKIIKTVDPAKDGEEHTLHIMIIPNGYGPFRIHLIPAADSK
ncbi:hypothetical protein [Effusibacillus lacus]|uniref:Uncharacterized protein n=1 Tax=Effusibacillus lacus TaxID=1348429 RepID=A0A292YEV2_9BACL|nr:hypothetical protein [Effusibacillus lacus]TCS73767.1 hypothetical protein EDD64_11667 [Effusibacillus lacus]GAX92022.1 hypothetical protein EFBL_3713 [Effusibacillus lacus]